MRTLGGAQQHHAGAGSAHVGPRRTAPAALQGLGLEAKRCGYVLGQAPMRGAVHSGGRGVAMPSLPASPSLMRAPSIAPGASLLEQQRQRARRPLPVPPCAAKGGGGGDKAKEEESKADFSALWARRFKQFFSARRQYLQQAEASPDEDKQKQAQKKYAAFEKRMEDLKDEYKRENIAFLTAEVAADAQRMVQVYEEAAKQAGQAPPGARSGAEEQDQAQGAVLAVTPDEAEASVSGRDVIELDIGRARHELRTSRRVKASIAMGRTAELIKSLILLPFTALATANQAWQAMFASQSYQNFLMSEGERIWFWRNRMENERWFWERYAWDQLVFPLFCGVAYQLVTPANFIFAVLVPLALSLWQHGELPGLFTIDFWTIAYFGFYRKCWPQVSAAASNVVFGW